MHRNRLHIFKSSVAQNFEKACYFLERNFGNLVIYPRHFELEKKHEDFFKSKGGIYRQVDTKIDKLDQASRLFQVYGAALVLNSKDKDIKLLCEQFGVDMYDHHMDYCPYGVLVYHDKKSYLFLNDSYLLDRGVIRDAQSFKEVEIEGICFQYLYASYFRGVNHITKII